MFVLSKDVKPKTANLICDKENKWAGWTNWGKGTFRDKEGNLVERKQKPTPQFSPRNNIWKYNTGAGYTTKDKFAFEHPAMFPEALAMDHILSWSNEGDLVLDPFMGAGTTAACCIESNRNYVGYEIDEKYYDICRRRIEKRVTIQEPSTEQSNALVDALS
jgi:site-specific DNA-methyltransferase (adenine-specific)